MAEPLPLDLHKVSKSKRGHDREGSPRPDEERRGRRNDGSKRTRKGDDDSESIQQADLLEEVVDSGHHAIEKEKEKQKQLVGMSIQKIVPMPQLNVDLYSFQTGEDPGMMVATVMVPQLDGMPSRGWTEPVKEQKKTHFSSKETEILRAAIIDYCKRIGYKEENISEFLFSKKRDLNTGRDAKCLPHRSVASVYYHAKRKFRQLTRGEWTEVDIEELRKLVQQYGTKWEKIGQLLNRTSHSCRDKYRDLSVPLMPTTGKWSKDEDKRLRDAVMEVHGGAIPETGILWSQVAEKMKDAGRARSQCRFRWESLKKGFDGEDVKQFWSQSDCLLLLDRIQQSGVEDETEIVWRQIQPQGFQNRTAKDLYNKWRYLKSLYCAKNFVQAKEPIDKVLAVIRDGITSSKSAQ